MQKLTELIKREWKIEIWEDELEWINTFAQNSAMNAISSSVADTLEEAVNDLYYDIKARYPLQWE